MPINGWYAGNSDNVTDDGNVNGWADKSGEDFGNPIAGGVSYRYGSVINYYGTWGQLIYANQKDLIGQDLSNPTGLNGHMPANPGPHNSNWVQGHLVNGECGGHSDEAAYLTPITHNINMWHAGYESVLQNLVNRGKAEGAATQFNPNKIANSRIIYRTHGLPPPTGSFATVPRGMCVSLGIVINGVMQSEANVQKEFSNPGAVRWFANRYYDSSTASERKKILEMIGGTEMQY